MEVETAVKEPALERKKLFAQAYISTGGNATQASKLVKPHLTDKSASIDGVRMLANASVKEEIQNLFQDTRKNFLTTLNKAINRCSSYLDDGDKEDVALALRILTDLSKSIGSDGVPKNMTQINKYALPKR